MGFSKKAIFVLLGVLLLGSGLVMAMGGAGIESATDLPRWSASNNIPTQNDTTEGGNITALLLNSSSGLTDKWAGYFGNVTSVVLYLTDNNGGSSAYLFVWAAGGNPGDWKGGHVCASEDASFGWSSVSTTTAAAIDTAWGFGSAADNAANTFTASACDLDFVADPDVTGTIRADGDSGSSTFSTCAVDDGGSAEGDFAFCVDELESTTTGKNYLNKSANFEFIVPTTVGQTETYYFFVEVIY